MLKAKSLIFTIVVLSLMALAVLAQSQPAQLQSQGREILKKVGVNAPWKDRFQMEGHLTLESKTDGVYMKIDLPFAYAQGKEGKYRGEIRIPVVGQLLFVSDGKTEWMYFAFDKEYSKKPFLKKENTESFTEIAAGLRAFGLPFSEVAGADITSEVKNVHFLREEAIKINGKDTICDVIEVEYDLSNSPLKSMADGMMDATAGAEPVKPVSKEPTSEGFQNLEQKMRNVLKEPAAKMTMWVDRDRSLVVRYSSSGGILGQIMSVLGDTSTATISTELSVMKVNDDVSDALFSFTPPADAKEKIEKAPADNTAELEELLKKIESKPAAKKPAPRKARATKRPQ